MCWVLRKRDIVDGKKTSPMRAAKSRRGFLNEVLEDPLVTCDLKA